MEKEFVTYEQALALKELDYDEPCLAKFIVPGDLVLPGRYENTDVVCATITQNDICEAHVLAPIKQQVFRWFREKYYLVGEIYTGDMGAIEYSFQIRDLYSEKYIYDNFQGAGSSYMGTFNTYEEAENACIDKLIELAKQQDNGNTERI